MSATHNEPCWMARHALPRCHVSSPDEADSLRSKLCALRVEVDGLREDNKRKDCLIESLMHRIADQAELLAKRANKPTAYDRVGIAYEANG